MLFDHYPIDFFEKIRAENAKTAVEDLRDRGFIKLPLQLREAVGVQSGTATATRSGRCMTVIRIRDKKVIDIVRFLSP